VVALRVGVAVGILLIVEAAMWLETVGTTTESIAPTLLAITVRELGPLIACLVVIGRSGVAMATELASMKVRGEIDVLESQGIDTMQYLVMPRMMSMMFSVFTLAVMVVGTIFVSGYGLGLMTGVIHAAPHEFFHSIFGQLRFVDLTFFFPKTLVSGLLIGAVCCVDGLNVRPVTTEVPAVASRSGVHALTAFFVVNTTLSLIVYGRILVFQVL
jgi:phospholipid/cholesterol/gamma-HCH transport system permease protein